MKHRGVNISDNRNTDANTNDLLYKICFFFLLPFFGLFLPLLQEILCFTLTLCVAGKLGILRFFWQQDITILVGHPPSADLTYGEEGSISQSTHIFAAIKNKLRIYTVHIPPHALKK